MRRHLAAITIVLASGAFLLPGLCSCSGGGADGDEHDKCVMADTLTHHARYLTIADQGNGTVRVDIADPWDSTRTLARYALVARDSVVPEGLGADVRVIRTPVSRAAVFSAVHTGGLDELGAIGTVVAVADGRFFPPTDTVTALIAEGRISDVGPAQAPSAELLAASGAEVVLRSPIDNAGAGVMPGRMTAVECIDYMEPTPIGRAEWLLLLGELTGNRDKARTIFDGVIDCYSDLIFKASGAESARPKVLVETEYSGIWYLPAGESYMARMIADAGGDYPWSDTPGTGSLALSLEKVAERAIDADVWLTRTFGYTADSSSLIAQNNRYGRFRPVSLGNIYGCDTSVKPIFNDIAFHPERILADYVAIFHPEVMPGYELQYFSKSK